MRFGASILGCSNSSLTTDPDPPHLPDLETFEGIQETFAVINVLEMSDILHPKTYQKYPLKCEEQMAMITSHQLARRLTNWILARRRLTSSNFTLHQYFWQYLAHQARAVVLAKHLAENQGVWSYTKTPIASKVEALVHRHFKGIAPFWEQWDVLEERNISWFDPQSSFMGEILVLSVEDIEEGANLLFHHLLVILFCYRARWLARG